MCSPRMSLSMAQWGWLEIVRPWKRGRLEAVGTPMKTIKPTQAVATILSRYQRRRNCQVPVTATDVYADTRYPNGTRPIGCRAAWHPSSFSEEATKGVEGRRPRQPLSPWRGRRRDQDAKSKQTLRGFPPRVPASLLPGKPHSGIGPKIVSPCFSASCSSIGIASGPGGGGGTSL